jgi:glycerophosphoryl diester phosphodiesterase
LAVAFGRPLIAAAEPPQATAVVGHRGLLLDAPENTSANFAACLELRVGFEFDVRRSRDGALVCIHDDTVDRTTDGQGRVADLTVEQLRRLDAGGWFAAAYRGQRIPTIDDVLGLLARHPQATGPFAVDLKADDPHVEADVIRLAEKHRVLDRLLFIGRTIDHADVRRRLRAAGPQCHTAALAGTREELSGAIADADSDWVYLRFIPDAADVAAVRASGKRSFLSGPKVSGLEPENWKRAAAAGVDAILSDYSLECGRLLKAK